MDAIFGETESPELFDAKNGLLIYSGIEAKFESGLFAIVPDLPDDPTADQIVQWQEVSPKEYKLKIVDRDPAKMSKVVPELGDGMTWESLDGKRLQFRSSYRPRVRYLYFNFCLQILRLAFKERHQGEILREQELGRPFWGSPGKYVKRNMLLSFVEEVGHRYDNLLEGPLESSDSESEAKEGDDDDDLLLLAATREIDLSKGSTRVSGEEEDSDEEQVEDDDDESGIDTV